MRPIANISDLPHTLPMRAIPLYLLCLAACGRQVDTPVQKQEGSLGWKATYSAAECKALTERDAYFQRCYGGSFAEENYVGDLKCMPYSSPERLTGVWIVRLEYSGFFPSASTYKDTQSRADKIWLEAEPSPSPEVVAAGQGAGTRAYSVDLIGRRSLCTFHYGHLGMSSQEIIAERIVAMRPLPGPDR